MKSVFVVAEGCYSDRTTEAVCSTRELADLYIERHSKSLGRAGSWNVEEWTVDEWDKREVPRTIWWTRVNTKTGAILKMGEHVILASPQARAPRNCPSAPLWLREAQVESAKRGGYLYTASFVSPEHAEKLAVEARQKWLRMKG